jgi:NAD(P)-dependent dehydrogenase (short-subunit alcohol dehydrogenase family)
VNDVGAASDLLPVPGPAGYGGRGGALIEIAGTIMFITSEQAGFLTGQTVFIDGGVTAA